MVGIAITEMAEDFAVFVWWRHGVLVVRHNALVADVHGDLDGVLVVHRVVCGQKCVAFWGSRRVAEHRFIDWVGDVESSVGHCE